MLRKDGPQNARLSIPDPDHVKRTASLRTRGGHTAGRSCMKGDASWTDRKRRHAPIGPPATMSGGTTDTAMMTVSVLMPDDHARGRSTSDRSICGISERLQPRDTEQTENDNQCISLRASGLVVPPASNQTMPIMPGTPAAAYGAAANIQPLAARGGLRDRLTERAREKAGRR